MYIVAKCSVTRFRLEKSADYMMVTRLNLTKATIEYLKNNA